MKKIFFLPAADYSALSTAAMKQLCQTVNGKGRLSLVGNTIVKAAYLLLLTCCFAVSSYAQAPQGIPYQASARNSGGAVLASTSISVRFTIRESISTGTITYRETHTATTSTDGIFSLTVGQGTAVTGTFSNIDWGTNAKFMQVELDPAGGSSYINMGTQQMWSVPYALSAACVKLRVSPVGDTLYSGNCSSVIIPGISAANCMVTAGTITGTATACTGGTTTLASSATGGVWSSSASGIATVNSSGIVTGVAVGTATISYIVAESCGSDTATMAVNVITVPSVENITGTASVCAGSTTSLTSVTTGGTWNSSATSIVTVGSTGIVTGVAAGTATISYTITNSCGNTVVTSIITVNPLPTAGTITGSAAISGCGTTLSNTTSGGVWSSSNTSVITISSGGVAVGIATGSAIISYTVTNGCGTSSDTIAVSTSITIAIGACYAGGKVAYILQSGDAGYTAGEVKGLIVYPSHLGSAEWGCAGTTITTSQNLGTGASNTSAIVAACTTAGIAAKLCDDAVLNGYSDWHLPSRVELDKLWINRSSIGVFEAATYYWSSSDAGASAALRMQSNDNSYHGANRAGVNRVLAVRYFGCTLPTVGAITGTASVCTGSTTSLTIVTSGGTWNSSATSIATVGSTGTVTGVAAGTATISYSVSNGCGSTVVTSIVTVNTIPGAGPITGSDTVISGSTITLSNATTGGTWSSSNTGIATVGSTGVVNAVSVGIATISYTVTNSCGSNVATKAVTVPITIGAAFGGGKIAHIYQSGEDCYVSGEIHGLIAAPSDHSVAIPWWNGSYVAGSYASPVWVCYGMSNTNAIITAQGNTGAYAAKVCADLEVNGYSDWYLPSRNELVQLFYNRAAIGGFSTTSGAAWYWSSTNANTGNGWLVHFIDGNVFPEPKNNAHRVRAVRTF